ncbi:MAG TPA: arsenic resistance N-acetyltransferase ArsN2 [Rubrobacteraceae bacterium]|nr:arsenic resistance N-acetyltransferase ArsN2 [Rubrobacteraceae bacterium]
MRGLLAASIPIEPARPGELPEILALLEECGLPPDGLGDHLSSTLVARWKGRVVGSAALELYERTALLRSIAVRRDLRGAGLGGRLTAVTLNLALELGVEEAYLLTETASSFFPRFGFRRIPRSKVPEDVRRSVEFVSACPAGARAMALTLRAG